MNIAMYQPDIPQNLGAMIRLCACLNVGLEIIEPCGFPWNDKKIRQSAMDYYDQLCLKKHSSWQSFVESTPQRRIVLLTTKASQAYTSFTFETSDVLLLGQESSGVPQDIHDTAFARVAIPMHKHLRSLNIVNASAMVLGEALRQTKGFEAF